MHRFRLFLFLTVIVAILPYNAFSKDKSKSDLNRIITHAKFVMLTTLEGNNLASAKVPPEDIKAFQATDAALHKWGRYVVVYTPNEADLIIVARAGRIASVHGGIAATDTVTIGHRPDVDPTDPTKGPQPRIGSQNTGAEVGPSEDMLEIFDAHLGVDNSSPPWRGLKANGLKGADPALVKDARKWI